MASTIPDQLRQFRDDPRRYFEYSITKMHSVPREELEAMQLEAMRFRVAEHLDSIEMVAGLANRVGFGEVAEFDDIAPLLFPHTVFKSYPASLLDKKRYDLMTKWLDKQTSYDLGSVDTEGCDSIDEWIECLDDQTPLQPVTSSGTTGTISIIPKSRHGFVETMRLWRLFLFQKFGDEGDSEEWSKAVDVIWPNYARGKLGNLRLAEMLRDEFTGGDPSRFHALYDEAISTDLLFLFSKMRAAASRGETAQIEVDPALLARRDEFEAVQANQQQALVEFFDRLTGELAGKKVFMTSAYPVMYDLAQRGLDRGVSGVFHPESAILVGGGTKGFVLPDNFMDIIREFLGVPNLQEGYGMSEISALHWACDLGKYHIQPWVVPFLLDPDTSEPLPREGRVTGRAAFFDFMNESHWGGVISGDEITIDWTTPCECGLTSIPVEHEIMRYSEKEGVEDDRISCSATEQVQTEVIEFLQGVDI